MGVVSSKAGDVVSTCNADLLAGVAIANAMLSGSSVGVAALVTRSEGSYLCNATRLLTASVVVISKLEF